MQTVSHPFVMAVRLLEWSYFLIVRFFGVFDHGSSNSRSAGLVSKRIGY